MIPTLSEVNLKFIKPRDGLIAFASVVVDDYDIKARELKEREAEVATQIAHHESGDQDFRTTLECLIGIASQAVELFARSKTEQKRQLMAFMFSNLRLRGKKLEYTMRSPFDLMVALPDRSRWLALLDTIRTERFADVIACKPLVRAWKAAA